MLRVVREQRMQGVEPDESGAFARSLGSEGGEIGEVADAPIAA